MPTVLRADGLRVAIYLNDRPPRHVHVVGPGRTVVVNLLGPRIRSTAGCNEQQAQRALDLVAAHHNLLAAAWEQPHG